MWIVCQIGAREHYAIPRALHRAGQLSCLVTDTWVSPDSFLGKIPAMERLGERWNTELQDAQVIAYNSKVLAFEIKSKLLKRSGWPVIFERNKLFQKHVLRSLPSIVGESDSSVTLFSYSYAALDLFKEAKRRGWKTVLGQIDPGPNEDLLVKHLCEEHPVWAGTGGSSPPPEYWDLWREECELADRVLVNSEWSRSLVAKARVEPSKLEIIPLALEDSASPLSTSTNRMASPPLRLLFLGQAIVRKGIHDLVATARLLDAKQWQIDVVGPHGPLPENLPACLRFHGGVPRSEAASWYKAADVFILPTHSDGFAITQLEAMAHGLPVIATHCCGDVVKDGVNGWIIKPGDPIGLSALLNEVAQNPNILPRMREAAKKTVGGFSLETVSNALLQNESL